MPTFAKQVPWPRDPHTAAKHAIYRRYLDRWWPILIRGYSGDATYAEGFAGPGVYDQGESGSPVIALEALLARKELRNLVKRARLLFVDADERCTGLLARQLQAVLPRTPLTVLRDDYNVDVRVELGSCEPTLENLLDASGAWGHPMLVVLDTFGGAVPARLLQRVAANVASEVLVTIQPQYFLRFAGADADVTDGDEVFGSATWRQVVHQPSAGKARWLMQQYRQTVVASGFSHVLDFELIDARGQLLYLVFGTTHQRGLEKMKEVMWEVDEATGIRYRDPRDPGQQALEIELEPQTAPLRRQVLAYLQTQPGHQCSVGDVREFALFHTVYKAAQVRPVLTLMRDSGEIGSDTTSYLRSESEVWLVPSAGPR